MAIDRQATGLTALRVCVGVFFVSLAVAKYRWLADSSILGHQLSTWLNAAPAGSMRQTYLARFAVPGVAILARLVPLGELCCGAAMAVGLWTPVAALVAFLMVMNFHFASGEIATLAFLTDGYGLPVVGAALALMVGGVRLPWSVRG